MRPARSVAGPARLFLLGCCLTGCLAGCVAPAPTTSAYESKATRTAKDGLSEVQTARMAAQSSLRGQLQQAYLETTVSRAEDAFGSIQSTFDSVQPPDDPAADQLRDSLEELLTDGSGGLGQLRIAVRRRQTDQVAQAVQSLGQVAAGLDRFAREHAG
jgi:hypothetical protein